MEVFWNREIQAIKMANTTNATPETLTVCGVPGVNLLKFREIGNYHDYFGMIIDEISLTCDGVTKCLPVKT